MWWLVEHTWDSPDASKWMNEWIPICSERVCAEFSLSAAQTLYKSATPVLNVWVNAFTNLYSLTQIEWFDEWRGFILNLSSQWETITHLFPHEVWTRCYIEMTPPSHWNDSVEGSADWQNIPFSFWKCEECWNPNKTTVCVSVGSLIQRIPMWRRRKKQQLELVSTLIMLCLLTEALFLSFLFLKKNWQLKGCALHKNTTHTYELIWAWTQVRAVVMARILHNRLKSIQCLIRIIFLIFV